MRGPARDPAASHVSRVTRHGIWTATLHRRRGLEAKDAARPVSGASTWKSRSRRQRGLRRLRRARRAHDHSAVGSVGSTRSTRSPRPGPKPRPRTGRGASEPSSAIEEAPEGRVGVAARTIQRSRPDFADTSGRRKRRRPSGQQGVPLARVASDSAGGFGHRCPRGSLPIRLRTWESDPAGLWPLSPARFVGRPPHLTCVTLLVACWVRRFRASRNWLLLLMPSLGNNRWRCDSTPGLWPIPSVAAATFGRCYVTINRSRRLIG